MARIFSIRFLFRHQLYSALVSLRHTDDKEAFSVRYLDGDLDAVFSESKVVLSPSGTIESTICGPQKLAEALALTTRKAIGEHMKSDRRRDVATRISTKKEAR